MNARNTCSWEALGRLLLYFWEAPGRLLLYGGSPHKTPGEASRRHPTTHNMCACAPLDPPTDSLCGHPRNHAVKINKTAGNASRQIKFSFNSRIVFSQHNKHLFVGRKPGWCHHPPAGPGASRTPPSVKPPKGFKEGSSLILACLS